MNERAEDGLIIVPNNEDFFDLFDLCDCTEAVLDDGMTGDLEKWFLQTISIAIKPVSCLLAGE